MSSLLVPGRNSTAVDDSESRPGNKNKLAHFSCNFLLNFETFMNVCQQGSGLGILEAREGKEQPP